MRLDRLRTLALSLRQTTEVSQWGGLVFKVAGKVFFLIGLDGGVIDGVAFKCAPEEFAALTETDGITQAPYFAKRRWVRVADLAALPEPDLRARICGEDRPRLPLLTERPGHARHGWRLQPPCLPEEVALAGEPAAPTPAALKPRG